jgi:hypothetical protein
MKLRLPSTRQCDTSQARKKSWDIRKLRTSGLSEVKDQRIPIGMKAFPAIRMFIYTRPSNVAVKNHPTESVPEPNP